VAICTPIACQMEVFSADERVRYGALRARIDAAMTSIVEVERGYEVHLPGNDATLVLVADWTALERRCCPFFEFTISIGGSDASIRVALIGSPEVKRFLEAELGSRTTSPSALARTAGC
jgi:hypothetical protein